MNPNIVYNEESNIVSTDNDDDAESDYQCNVCAKSFKHESDVKEH